MATEVQNYFPKLNSDRLIAHPIPDRSTEWFASKSIESKIFEPSFMGIVSENCVAIRVLITIFDTHKMYQGVVDLPLDFFKKSYAFSHIFDDFELSISYPILEWTVG